MACPTIIKNVCIKDVERYVWQASDKKLIAGDAAKQSLAMYMSVGTTSYILTPNTVKLKSELTK